jgi:hypothetical protein
MFAFKKLLWSPADSDLGGQPGLHTMVQVVAWVKVAILGVESKGGLDMDLGGVINQSC